MQTGGAYSRAAEAACWEKDPGSSFALGQMVPSRGNSICQDLVTIVSAWAAFAAIMWLPWAQTLALLACLFLAVPLKRWNFVLRSNPNKG